ncbi:MAG: tRNA (adenosine(37)-N6)-threonylcarbamoyltransferase complex ATPase subunit type 1 TsaE [Planctomycetes bacterium]|nr:tRNA (adenosine(37)-N6)-threonylcarbamoyltransferase complex ATPase subunit type 1 TsaE [Planctomycetota bacterium]
MPRYELLSSNEDDTLAIGREVGALLPNGAFVALTGDHHAGKTLLVRGIAQGLDIPGWAALRAPGRTLMCTYHGGRCTLHHIDFYHINQAPEVPERIEDAIADPETICVVEWADVLRDVCPDHELIEIEMRVSRDNKRLDVIEDRHDLLPGLAARLARWLKPSPLEGESWLIAPEAAGVIPVGEKRSGVDRRRVNLALIWGDRRRGDRRRQG